MKIALKKSLQNVILMLMLLKICVIFGQKKLIVIDVGHGGKDTGAIGINGIQEKDVVLNIAEEILRLNKTILDNKLNIYLTRYKDTLISLTDRSRLAQSLNADVFVSLHCNASKITSKGMEVYVSSCKTEELNIKKSIELGLLVLNESTQNLHLKKRCVKFANFQVLRETNTFCPAILVETGFVSNIDEANYFLRPKNIRAIALGILIGITNYLNTGL